MAIAYRISVPQPRLSGSIILEPSKSLSNRALLIQSLCDEPFQIHNLSKSDDTKSLQAMLSSLGEELNSGHAGSSYRFMVARACLFDREVVLDGSGQLRKRPIGPLVRGLQKLGADIQYLNKEGFPPIRIKPNKNFGKDVNEITLQSGVSSQYISALLMIAPLLPNGLTIHMTDDPVSVSYIHMTLSMMTYFGISSSWEKNTIRVEPGLYVARDYTVEGDWSAASYYYSIAALAQSASFQIEGLTELSLQGDQVVRMIYEKFGIETTFHENGISIVKQELKEKVSHFEFDFSLCPDIALTVMVTLAGLGIPGKLTGLKTLRIKESDRVEAMKTELARVKTQVEIEEKENDLTCTISGKAKWKDKAKFDTYEDHRMAMALAPLACLRPVMIKNPEVVSKSYPDFWKDVEKIGMKKEIIKSTIPNY